ncbi:MAG: response regulator [Verrucomicrobiota bacterium]|nr:response regulator [Verrucomicrobiota bacterium]
MEASANRNHKNNLVFIVDDEALLCEIADALLTSEGFNTRRFLVPEEALAAFKDSPVKPALLVTDFVMGSMNGIDLIEHCKALSPELKTVLLSGTVGESTLRQYATQPDAFLPKPYQINTFLRVVHDALNS